MAVQGLAYVRAYYTGVVKLRGDTILRYEVKPERCPSFGEAGAIILDPNDAGKRQKTSRLTLFDPFTLTANSITPDAGEICTVQMRKVDRKLQGVKEPVFDIVPTAVRVEEQELDGDRVERLSKIITDNWEMRCRLGMQSDLDIAAVVLTRMGKPVPETRQAVQIDPETGKAKETAGKEAAPELAASVNPTSKPGRVLAYFRAERRSMLEAMAEFGATRSGVLTSLHSLWKNNGIGYSIAADIVEIALPAGCDDPFKEPAKAGAKQAERTTEKARGKPMLDEMLITALPEKGKRREVALACYKEPTDISAIAKQLDCSEGSVRSHLNDLHLKHGFGFEIKGGKARLITPKGWKP